MAKNLNKTAVNEDNLNYTYRMYQIKIETKLHEIKEYVIMERYRENTVLNWCA